MAKNPIFAVLWIALLFFIAWPVAGFCCAFWIFIQVSSLIPFVPYLQQSLDSEASHLVLCTLLGEGIGTVLLLFARSLQTKPLDDMLHNALSGAHQPSPSTFTSFRFISFIVRKYWYKQPFEACFGFVKRISAFLEKIVTWPREVGKAINDCSSSFPAPF